MVNIALDPEVATLAKELVLMGSGMYADNSGTAALMAAANSTGGSIRKPCASRCARPWKKITITPIDISVKTKLGAEIKAAIAKADTPVARYLTQFCVETPTRCS